MRKKEDWMFVGAKVLAKGKEGKITIMQENTLGTTEWVYHMDVLLDSGTYAGTYHPNDIKEIVRD